MINLKKIKLIALLCLGAAVSAHAQPLPFDPSIKTGKLSNGFTYFIRKNQEPKNRVTLYLVVKAGSILETEDQRGLAHFMEHMSFNGTKHFPKNQLVNYLQKSGVRFGADLNAYTSFDETVYQLPIPTDNPELLKNGLQIMRDWAGEAMLDQQEIDEERGVVLEEKRLRKGASERLQQKLFPFEVNNSRYGVRMPIGTEGVITGFKRPSILNFYKDWYRPDLEALIVVGDVDVAAIEKQVKVLFGDAKNPVKEKPRTAYKATLLNKNRFLVLTDPELSQTSVDISFKSAQYPQGSRERYKASLIRNLCSNLLASRLAELAKAPQSPVLGIEGGYGGVINGLAATTVSFTAKTGQFKAGFDYAFGALQQIRKHGFDASEIERVKAANIAQMEALLREKDKQNSTQLADELKRHFLVNEPAPGIVYETRLVKELQQEITPAIINAEIKKMLADGNRDIVITAPDKEKASLPNEATINSWINNLENKSYTTYADKADSKGLLSTQPTAGAIISETKNEALGLTTWKLSNGATVVLKPTSFKNDQIIFSAFAPGGTSLYSDADFQSAANAAGIVVSSGLGKHDPIALPKLLTGKQVQVAPSIGERFQGIDGGSSKADLETALQLVYGYFTAPRRDSAVFGQIITQSEQGIANRYASPQAVFQDTVAAVLGNYNSRRTGPSLQKLHRISLDRAYSIYKERFANAGGFTFVFTGSFTPAELKPLVEKYIASLPGGGPPDQARDLGIKAPAGNITKTVVAGTEDKATVCLMYHGDFTFSPEEAIRMIALKDVMEYRMLERLREKEGGVYSPGVQFSRSHDNADHYEFVVNFGCAPKNIDKLVAAAKEEIENMKKSGPQAGDLQKFKAEESRQAELSLQSNEYWHSYLTSKLQNGEDISSILGLKERINAVTEADIKAAANKYLGNDLLEFVLKPKP